MHSLVDLYFKKGHLVRKRQEVVQVGNCCRCLLEILLNFVNI